MLHFNGALVSRRALEVVGLCCESFFCGHEDRELGLRFAGAGWTTLCEPRAVVTHANFRDAQGRRRTILRRYYGWRNDLWLRINVRQERWARLRAAAVAAVFVTRALARDRPPWPEAQGRVCATFDAITGRLGRRDYWFLTDPSIAGRRVGGTRLSRRRPRALPPG
jgi:hypothetical protein